MEYLKDHYTTVNEIKVNKYLAELEKEGRIVYDEKMYHIHEDYVEE